MHIKSIKLVNYRNYEKLNLKNIPECINIVLGENAQGKTNLIEAINICANGKSFRVQNDSKAVMDGAESAYISIEYEKRGRTHNIEALIEKNRKSFRVDGLPVKNIKDMLGNLLVVVFSPEDIKTAKESPGLRRAFLDGEISKIRPSYVDALKKYSSIIAQKNAILRRKNAPHKKEMLEAFNQQLESYIKIILKNRIAYVKKLNEWVSITHAAISGNKEAVEIRYKAGILQENIAAQLQKLIPKEIDDMSANAGPHRDDLDIRLNSVETKGRASQGQFRTLMLAIKFACLKILEESSGELPILLLDDVLSELDDARKSNLFAQLDGVQCFLTTAQRPEVNSVLKTAEIQVEKGSAKLNIK